MVSNTRLYGAAIAVASGLYSLWSGTAGSRMVTSGWIMAGLGAVVVVHGALLLTDYATGRGRTSAWLMVGYSLAMLLLQALLGAGLLDDGSGMGMADGMGMTDGMGMGGSVATAGMGWDAGMTVLALLMLASGLIMLRDPGMDGGDGR